MSAPSQHLKRIAVWLSIGLVAAPALAQQNIGVPVQAFGDVSLTRAGATDGIRLSQPLYPADVVNTGERSFATLGFRSGWFWDLAASAEANLAWSPVPDVIYVTIGAVRAMRGPGAERARAISAAAEATATGTTFHFSVAPSGATSVYVEHGAVRFANRAGDTVTVTAGLASTVTAAAAPPTPPAPPPPALLEEATELATRAALERQPAEATPPEAFQRLRRLREASRSTARQVVAQAGAVDSLEPGAEAAAGGTELADWVVPGIAAGIIAGGILGQVLGEDDDDDDDRPGMFQRRPNLNR